MKKVLLLIESSETGGAEALFASLVADLDRGRYRPVPVMLHEGWLPEHLRTRGFEPQLLATGRGGFDYTLLRGLYGLIRRQRIDLVHSHLFGANVYASLAGALAGVPVIATFHGTMDVAADDRLRAAKWMIINRFSRAVVFVSRSLERHFVAAGLAAPAKGRVIYNGVDSGRFRNGPSQAAARQALGLKPEHFVVGCVGDLRPAKDYPTALRAAALLRGTIPGFRMLIAGSPASAADELEGLRDSMGLNDCVDFIGHRSRMEDIFPAFNLYLSTSLSEGFSLTVVEALAAGLPVVATRSGGPEEIIRDGETGILVRPGAPREVTAAALAIYRNGAASERMAAKGRQWVADMFSLHRMVENYQELYDEVGRGDVFSETNDSRATG